MHVQCIPVQFRVRRPLHPTAFAIAILTVVQLKPISRLDVDKVSRFEQNQGMKWFQLIAAEGLRPSDQAAQLKFCWC